MGLWRSDAGTVCVFFNACVCAFVLLSNIRRNAA
jgi:hypothetical protein